jgi:ubiquinone/menaquinone biosynthesis C-methylase UbiE
MDRFGMSMISAFDLAAQVYDSEFTFSETGKLQRRHILRYLDNKILNRGKLDILEINCGTGEDAIRFYKSGHFVLASDISSGMIRVARSKLNSTDTFGIEFRQMSFTDLNQPWMKGKYDLVFSNFGGLNCVNQEDLEKIFRDINGILKPGGRFIAVIMPRFCVWEFVYFFYKRQWKKIFRRANKRSIEANLSIGKITTWYYSPRQIRKFAKEYLIKQIKPIGIAIPPSFLEKFFKEKKFLLRTLDIIETMLEHLPFLASVSDHFLFDFEHKS